jgi:hypothetical protein
MNSYLENLLIEIKSLSKRLWICLSLQCFESAQPGTYLERNRLIANSSFTKKI